MIDRSDFDSSTIVLKAGDTLLPLHRVADVSLKHVEDQLVIITDVDGKIHHALGFDAIEIMMQLKPSALEGRRLKWQQGAWAFHNFVAHPLMQILVWLGYKKAAIRLHDKTTPRPR